ncbi:MAG: Ig-like domain-containing protein [Allosphingosinicella sp.]
MSWDEIIKGTSGSDIINGGSGDDFIQGRAGGDFLDGGAGNDEIQGNEGDDYIRGGAGNDFIHGGTGTDTAVYSGSIKDYTYSRPSSSSEEFFINQTGGSMIDGYDRLISVERLIFADATIDLTQNNAPIAFDDVASTNEDVGTYNGSSVLANDFDWEHQSLTATPGTFNGVYGTLVLNANGTYTYTPYASTQALALGQNVTDSFNYVVSDGSLTDTGTLTITIAGRNDAPVANPDAAGAGENQTITVNVLANDTDVDNGAILTVIAASAPAGKGTASIVGNQVQWNPGTAFDHLAQGATETVVVNYTISDEHGATSSSTVTITVTGTNDGPVANADTAAGTENQVLTINALANDTDVDDGAVKSLVSVSAPAGKGSASIVGGQVQFDPGTSFDHLAQGATETVVLNYTMKDEFGATSSSTITVTVTGTNDAPVAHADTASTGENSPVTVNVLANDTDVDDGAVLTVTAASAPVGQGSASVVANQVVFDPGTDFDYLDTGESANVVVSYSIVDDHGATSSSTVTITVNGANDAPVANDDVASTTEDASVSGNVLANDTDVDVEPLTVSNPGVYVGAYGTLTLAANGSYTYAPNAAAQGLDDGETAQDVFTYTASDGTASDSATLTVTVNGANDAPVANDDTRSTNEDSAGVSGNVLANDTDVDVEPLTVANPGTYVGTYGTLTLAADGSYTYTPGAAAQALDTGDVVQDVFSYAASDGTASDTATLTVTVTGINDAPVANDDIASTDENSPVTGNVLANDTDPDDPLTVTNPGTYIGFYGTLVLAADGSYTYTPGGAASLLNAGQSANDVFNYTASDGTVTDAATLTITVNGLSGVPDAVDDNATTNENNNVSGNVLANDTDPEGDTLTVTNPGSYVGTYGTLTLGANGSYTYVPNAAANGLAAGESAQDVFTYTASDGTASDSATLTVTVNGINDAPTITGGDFSGSVAEAQDDENIPTHSDSGVINFSDVDVSDTHSASATAQGAFYLGTFSLDPVDQGGDSVTWNFSVSDAALDGLAEGEVRIQNYTVQVSDGHGGTDSQTVTITITGAGAGVGPQAVWYIDNSAVGSTNVGTEANPFTSIAAFNAAQGSLGGPQPGNTVHLLAGTGTGVYAEADGINLLDGQILVGDATGSVRPTITATAGDGIDVAKNNTITGVDVGSTSGAGIDDNGGTVGTLTVIDVGIGGIRTGQIVDIDHGGTLNVTLNEAASTSSSGGAIDLNAVGGSFTVTGATTIAGATGGGVDVTAGINLAVDFEGGLTASSGASTAVNFAGNAGSSSLLIDGLTLTTTTGTGLSVSSGGTVEVTGSGNTIDTAGGTAVNISFATIGGAGVTLESVSSVGGSATGIILNTAGSGGFEVTGSGSIAGSGGTIANKTGTDAAAPGSGVGVYINATSNVSLANMAITGNSNGGLVGSNVTDLTLTDSTLSNNGSSGSEGAIRITGLTGTSALLGNVIGGSSGDNVHIVQTGGTLDLTIADSASDQAIMGTVNNVSGNDSVFIGTTGSASLTLTVDGVEFQGAKGDLLQVLAEGNSSQNLVIENNAFNNLQASSVGGGVTLSGGGAGSTINVDYRVEDNVFTGAVATALAAGYSQQSGAVRGYIAGNTIGVDNGIAGSQGSSSGDGIAVALEKSAGAGDATYNVVIANNDIHDINSGLGGITVRSSVGTATDTAVVEAIIHDNVVDQLGAGTLGAFYSLVGGGGPGDFAQLGLDIENNTFDASNAAYQAVFLDQASDDAHYYLPGYTGSPDGEFSVGAGTASADIGTYLAGLGNDMTDGAGAFFPDHVDASLVLGVLNQALDAPWYP